MTALLDLLPPFAPWLAGAALHGLRLLPSALLSPFLGGPAAPALVRLALALGLGAAAQAARGTPPPSLSELDLLVAALRELAVGVGLGLIVAFPVEAARAGGRLADTARGATLSELHVAPLRQRESALGDLLAQWTVVLAGAAGGGRLLVAALLGTFEALPAGAAPASGRLLEAGLAASAELLGCALCLAAPPVAAVLAADLALALAARAFPQLGPGGASAPARAALGVAAVALAAGAIAGRLTGEVASSAGLVRALAGSRP
ncbi:MAG TPA: flagellar biosynthetic protein FliR [Anaeromyxobacteraceae bacterium]|nr:flagellar biosynthetic protein FliR [Anaeromyxobacteraceae bacterium]